MRILITDDEKDIADYLRLLLEDADAHHCDLAYNGKEALELAHKNQYDFIITDVQMPVMTGVDFVQRIRLETNLNQSTRVLVLSGNIDQRIVNSLNFPLVTFMNKPMYEAELLDIIDSCRT